MRKLGTWSGSAVGAVLLAAALTGLAAGPAPAQDRATPWLGVVTQSLDRGLRDGMDYEGDGVLVSDVVDGSPADRAGIEKGDIIVSVNARGVESPSELTSIVRGARVGQTVSVIVFRDGRRRTLSAKLGERSDDFDRSRADMEAEDLKDLRDLPRKLEREIGPTMRWNTGDGDGLFNFRTMGRGRLGVRVESLNSDLGSYFDAPDGKGALILEVLSDTPADRAGLKAGDVVVQIGDDKIADADDVVEALSDAPEGKISVTVMRKGTQRTFEAELEEGPRAFRGGRGGDVMVMRPRGRDQRIVIPEIRRDLQREMQRERREARRGAGESEELRELRQELRELQEKLDRMEGDRD